MQDERKMQDSLETEIFWNILWNIRVPRIPIEISNLAQGFGKQGIGNLRQCHLTVEGYWGSADM